MGLASVVKESEQLRKGLRQSGFSEQQKLRFRVLKYPRLNVQRERGWHCP